MSSSSSSQVGPQLDYKLIEAVKKYPEIYVEGPIVQWPQIWSIIATEINRHSSYCESKWLEIYKNYLKIQHLIKKKWTLESIFLVHPKTRMYLDGTLKFLDPFIEIAYTRYIPHSIHQSYRWTDPLLKSRRFDKNAKNTTSATLEMVQTMLRQRFSEKLTNMDKDNMKSLLSLVEANVKESIMKYKKEKEQQLNEDAEINFSTDDVILDHDDRDSNTYEEGPLVATIHVFSKNNETAAITDDIIDVNKEQDEDENITEQTEPQFSDPLTNNNAELKTFFNDLVDAIADKLTVEKQRELQKGVYLLAVKLIEENDK